MSETLHAKPTPIRASVKREVEAMLRRSRASKNSRKGGLNNEFTPFAPFMAPLAEIAREFIERTTRPMIFEELRHRRKEGLLK